MSKFKVTITPKSRTAPSPAINLVDDCMSASEANFKALRLGVVIFGSTSNFTVEVKPFDNEPEEPSLVDLGESEEVNFASVKSACEAQKDLGSNPMIAIIDAIINGKPEGFEEMIQTLNELHRSDATWTKSELKAEYGSEHPFYTRVRYYAADPTELGYWKWVMSQIQQNVNNTEVLTKLVKETQSKVNAEMNAL